MSRLLFIFLFVISPLYAAFTVGDTIILTTSHSGTPEPAAGALPLTVTLMSTPTGYSSDLAFTWRLYEDDISQTPFYERSLSAEDFYEFSPLHLFAIAGFTSEHWQDLQGVSSIEITAGRIDYLQLEHSTVIDDFAHRGTSAIPEPMSYGILFSAGALAFASFRRRRNGDGA